MDRRGGGGADANKFVESPDHRLNILDKLARLTVIWICETSAATL